MLSLLTLISQLITLYIYVILAGAVLSWLVAFRIVNPHNRFVYALEDFLARLTEPAYRWVRRVLPPIGSFDLSPLIVILLLIFVRSLLWEAYAAAG